MYRIDGCVSSPLIQYMCKSVQSSFYNCSINTVYSCTLKLKWLGKGLLSLTKYGPISRTAVFLVYRQKEIFNETKRPLYANIWNRKRLSSYRTLLIRQILPLVIFSYSGGSKNTSLEEHIKRAKVSVSAIFQCLNSIPQKDYANAFENWIKKLKLCVSHGGEYFEGLR